jgi:hypothetical protein
MKRKYLGERADEDETRGTKSKWLLFNKITYIIGSSPKVIGLFNVIDSGEKKKKLKDHKKKKEKRLLNLNDESSSPSPSDSSHDHRFFLDYRVRDLANGD